MAIQLGASAGNATASDVLAGVTFSNATQQNVAGTMANNGSPTWTPGASAISLTPGYYSGGTIAGLQATYGTLTSFPTTDKTFTYANGDSLSTLWFSVTGLAFTPIFVAAIGNYNLLWASIGGYLNIASATPSANNQIALMTTDPVSSYSPILLDGTVAYFDQGTFELPLSSTAETSLLWVAYGF